MGVTSKSSINKQIESTTESKNNELGQSATKVSKQEPCIYHRVDVSDQLECQKPINLSESPLEKEDLLLKKLKKDITVLKKSLGLSEPEILTQPQQQQFVPDKEVFEQRSEVKVTPRVSKYVQNGPKPNAPLVILCAHPTPPDQLMIHWKPIANLPFAGFEIDVDGVPAAKVYSPTRNAALLYDINLDQKHLITIYAIPFKDDPNVDPLFFTPACFCFIPNSQNQCQCSK